MLLKLLFLFDNICTKRDVQCSLSEMEIDEVIVDKFRVDMKMK